MQLLLEHNSKVKYVVCTRILYFYSLPNFLTDFVNVETVPCIVFCVIEQDVRIDKYGTNCDSVDVFGQI